MAYDSLKALIRQYIKTNGEQEITGQILQNVLIEMVNQYPSTDGFATQSWVTSQGYITASALTCYLPLTGGTIKGSSNDYKVNILPNGISVQYSDVSSDTDTITEISSTGIYFKETEEEFIRIYKYSTQLRIQLEEGDYASLRAGSFIKNGGTSAQFLKADGSVDSNTYVTASALTGYATQSWVTTQLGNYLPLTGGTIKGSSNDYKVNILPNGISVQYSDVSSDTDTITEISSTGIYFKETEEEFIRIYKYSTQLRIQLEDGDYASLMAGSFIKNGGTSAQFLKADGSVDSNAYITASALSGYATQSWVTTQLASYNPTTNFKTINNQSIIGTGNINIEGGGMLYDAEVEYLEGVNGAYIKSGVFVNNTNWRTFKLEFDGVWMNSARDLWLCQGIGYYYPTFYIAINQSYRLSYGTGAGDGSTNRVLSFSEYTSRHRYTADYQTGYVYFDDEQYQMALSASTSLNNVELYLFTWNSNNYNLQNYMAGGRLYGFKIYQNNTIVRDFIPVRVGNVGYLYDKVSGELFGNSGTGSFVLGQDTGPGGGLPYLPLTGGTITGNLTVNGILTASNGYLNIYSVASNHNTIFEFTDSQDVIFSDGGEYFFNATVNAPAFNNTSDLRKKTIMGDVPINLYNVANAPLFKFTWNDEKKYSGQHIGSAAQYWQTVLPELVSIGRDADMTLAMQYDVIALASAITVAKTVVNHEERIILLERENEALKKEIADLKSA